MQEQGNSCETSNKNGDSATKCASGEADEVPNLWAVLIVTPIMKRAQKLLSASEIVFIDSTASVDAAQSSLTVVLVATQGGAVPIAVLIHSNQSIAGYEIAFSLLKKHYPNCFGGKSVSAILKASLSYVIIYLYKFTLFV